MLTRRRSLTLNMIRRLHEGLGILAESLIKGGENGQDAGCEKSIRRVLEAGSVEFIDENGGGTGVRLRKRPEKKH